jgi:CRISPR system Cascade subunit CasB
MKTVLEQEKESPFITYLQGFSARGDRAALAALRRCLGRELAPPPEAMRLVVPWLKDDFEDRRLRHFLLAGLYAMHPLPGGTGSLGASLLKVGDHESARKRFEALLDADLEQLPHRLRQAISLALAKNVPVDWHRLFRDLGQWEHPKRFVQFQWARDYWRGKPQENPALPEDDESTEEE